MKNITTKSIVLKSRNQSPLFEYQQQNITVGPSDLLVHNLCFSIDPIMKVWLSGAKTNFRNTQIGSIFNCFGVGIVVQGDQNFKVNEYVFGNVGTTQYIVFDEKRKMQCFPIPKQLIEMYGVQRFLYYINNGLAAYSGFQFFNAKQNQTVVVSTAAGATGLILCQLLKQKNVKIIGLTSQSKVEKLKKFVDIAVDYKKTQEVKKALRQNKFSYYFDNVGENLLDLALAYIKNKGKVAMCGAIASYGQQDPGIKNIGLAISKRLTFEGVNFSYLVPRAPSIFKEFKDLQLPLATIQISEFEKNFSKVTTSGNDIIGKVIIDLSK